MFKLQTKQVIPLLLTTFFVLSGCNDDTREDVITEPTKVDKFSQFKMESMSISLVGNGSEKYKLDQAEDDDSEEGQEAFTNMLESLENIGVGSLDSEHEGNVITLAIGQFYNMSLNFTTPMPYTDGLKFSFTLLSQGEGQTETDLYNKIIDSGIVDTVDEAGEYSLNVETLIPTDIKAGKYLFVATLLDADLDRIVKEEKPLNEIPEMGSFIVEIENTRSAKRIELVDVYGSPYIDLPYKGKFIDGYTHFDTQTADLIIYNSSAEQENITISARLELETGESFELGLLDTSDAEIKKEVNYSVAIMDANEVGNSDLSVTYFLPEAGYGDLIDILPDLSYDLETDGIEGTIYWSITSDNDELTLNDHNSSVLLSKYIGEIEYQEQGQDNANLPKSHQRSNLADKTNSQFSIINSSNKFVKSWASIDKLSGNKPKGFDAALDYDENTAYLFSGENYYSFYKLNNYISYNGNTAKDWPGVNFDSIDAAIGGKRDYIYFFSGDEYIKYNKQQRKALDGYPKKIADHWPGLEKLASIEAAIEHSSNNNILYFFGKDKSTEGTNSYIRYDLSKNKTDDGYPRKVKGNWGDIEETEVSAAFKLKTGQSFFFTNKPSRFQNLLQNGVLFEYGKEFNKDLGKKDKIGLGFKSEFKMQGLWSVPGVSGEAEAGINLHILNKEFSIIKAESEVALSLGVKHEKVKQDQESGADKKKLKLTAKNGSSIKVSVFGGNFYNQSSLTEKEPEDELPKEEEKKKEVLEEKKEENKDKGFEMPNYEWETKTVLVSSTFTVGPVPVKFTAGVEGSLKLESSVGFEGVGVKLALEIPADLTFYVTGGVNGGVVRAGIRGEANIIDAKAEGSMRAGLNLSDTNDLVFAINIDSNLSLKLLRAQVAFYAGTRTKAKWCQKRVLGVRVSYPCGLDWHEYVKYFYQTPWVFNRNFVLLKEEIPVLTLPLNR